VAESPARRTDQQAEAGAERERDVFLRAGAGTGKTTVLVDRFCAAALDPEVGVEHILAFTFTDRAADQLRRRVREALARRAREASGEELEQLQEAERATDRAWISTIHGFCRRLLASHPAAAGLDPRFRVVDEPEADRLASRAFDDALERLVEGGGAEALELAAANHRRTLLEMTRGAHDELRSQGEPEPELPAPPPVDTAARIGELIGAAREAHAACAEVTKELEVEGREQIAGAMGLDPAAEASVELLESLARMKPRSKAGPFREKECERYKRALERARSAVAAQVLAPAYEQLRELVRRYGTGYEELKAERSALDFEDLQLRAVALLRSSDTLRERYREQFRELMVDEFQDTNALQLSLIEQLRGPDTRLFMVGDEFQSIYGFRHADVDVYRRQHHRFDSGEEPNGVALPLTGNFRAAPEVVAASNAIGAALLGDFEPLSAAGGEEPASGPRVEMLLTLDDRRAWEDADTQLPRLPDDPSSGSKVAEARLLAARLRELVDDGEDPAEIVVLLRAFTHVNTIERALADAGLDPYVVGGRGFWSQQQIEDMGCLLAVIANPLDDQPLMGALASPACGVLPDTLWLLRQAATRPREEQRDQPLHLWPVVRDLAAGREPGEGRAEPAALIPDEERGRLATFADRLERLRRIGTEGGLEALVERVATAFGYDLATLMRDDGQARWSNVRKLMRLAREFEAREGPDLASFLEYLESSAASRDRESEAATRAEGHAGVRVMTVHAAKGLEFGVVAVADLGRNLQLGWSPLRVGREEDKPDEGELARVGVQLGRLGRPAERIHDYEELTELAASRGAEEEGRLAYVAATRAERRLLLSGTYPRRLPKPEEADLSRRPIAVQLIRALLEDDLDERLVEIPPAARDLPAGTMTLRVSRPAAGAGAALLAPRAAEGSPAAAPEGEPPLGRPAAPPALSGGLSYSALSEYARCGYRFYVERVLGISEPERELGEDHSNGDSPAGPARQRYGPGVAVHELLEWSALNRWRRPSEAQVEAALAEQGADPAQGGRAMELISGFLDSPLAAELKRASVKAEAPFVLELDGTLIRGSIDLLVERGDGSALVLDYKTDRLDGRDPAEAAEGYRVQRDLYALAASARAAGIETAYVFLEQPGAPVRAAFGEQQLEEARARVSALLAELRSGSFEVTRHPHKRLCLDCPARERLCSHEPPATLRDEADPAIEPSGRGEPPAEAPGEPEAAQLTLLDR
jgi:ATP-dependent exoDNAse (exonuclease V) beta subunit